MKINFHKKIARYFGYEFTKIERNIFHSHPHHIIELIKRLDINLILDVGANMGQFTQEIRAAGYSGKIISFEPIKQCYKHCLSISDNNWTIMNYGLGEKPQEKKINISHKSVFSSLLEVNDYGRSRFSDSIAINDYETIQLKTLDQVLAGLIDNIKQPRIFLKLDTQGYDMKVLEGAQYILSDIYLIQTEVSCKPIYNGMPPHFKSLEYLSTLGYEITGLFPLSHDKKSMSLLEFDCVLRKNP